MTPRSKKNAMTLLVIIVPTAIIIATFLTNGAEKDDAWLYGVSIWGILAAGYDLYSKKDKDAK